MSQNPLPKGVVVSQDGSWIIPASRRSDGTWRKEMKVKPGYIPQEEIQAFQTVASRRQKGSGIPGLPPPPPVSQKKSKQQVKPKKTESFEKEIVVEPVKSVAEIILSSITDTEDLTNKRLRLLRKKLREIDELKLKISNGIINPSVEQIEKIKRQVELEQEISTLEQSITQVEKESYTTSMESGIESHNESLSKVNIDSLDEQYEVESSETNINEKRIRALRKKLRQIEELENKVSQEGNEPSPEQTEKLLKKTSLISELASLGVVL